VPSFKKVSFLEQLGNADREEKTRKPGKKGGYENTESFRPIRPQFSNGSVSAEKLQGRLKHIRGKPNLKGGGIHGTTERRGL